MIDYSTDFKSRISNYLTSSGICRRKRSHISRTYVPQPNPITVPGGIWKFCHYSNIAVRQYGHGISYRKASTNDYNHKRTDRSLVLKIRRRRRNNNILPPIKTNHSLYADTAASNLRHRFLTFNPILHHHPKPLLFLSGTMPASIPESAPG